MLPTQRKCYPAQVAIMASGKAPPLPIQPEEKAFSGTVHDQTNLYGIEDTDEVVRQHHAPFSAPAPLCPTDPLLGRRGAAWRGTLPVLVPASVLARVLNRVPCRGTAHEKAKAKATPPHVTCYTQRAAHGAQHAEHAAGPLTARPVPCLAMRARPATHAGGHHAKH